jgi:hypothetical protein
LLFLISKRAKEVIIIIGGPEREKYFNDGLIAKGFAATLKYPEK